MRHSRTLAGTAIALTCVLALTLAGCGSKSQTTGSTSTAACQQVGSVSFDKTKFLLHAGLAFGAFHHFIYNPYRSGSFRRGARGRVGTTVKAGLAGLFTVHELKLVKQDAESSPTLCHLVAPLDEASNSLTGMQSSLRSGNVTGHNLNGVNGDLDSVGQTAQQAGMPITDQVPTDAQLANPN
jgi:hypothetical protein